MARDEAERKMGDNSQFMRLAGSMPWFKQTEKRQSRAKIFKSGNSLAVRIPAGTNLKAGMEMNLTIEDGEYLTYDPVERPKRKFNIDKVWGCAAGSGMEFIKDEDREFEHRPLLWEDPAWLAMSGRME